MPVGVQAEGGEDVLLDEFEGLGLHCTASLQSCFDFSAVASLCVDDGRQMAGRMCQWTSFRG